MVKKILLSISCLLLFTLMSWAGAARAQNDPAASTSQNTPSNQAKRSTFYVGLGLHQHTLDFGDANILFPTKFFTIPPILGIMLDLGIPIAIELQYHSGTATKTLTLPTVKSVVTTKYGLTLLEVQPHLALSGDKSVFLIVGRGNLVSNIRVTISASSGEESAVHTDEQSSNYFGGGLQFNTGEKWAWRLEARRMRFPAVLVERGYATNTNVGVSGLYRF